MDFTSAETFVASVDLTVPLTNEQLNEIAAFFNSCEDYNLAMNIWKAVGPRNVLNAVKLHGLIRDRIVQIFTSGWNGSEHGFVTTTHKVSDLTVLSS